jgi:hypothetical protein
MAVRRMPLDERHNERGTLSARQKFALCTNVIAPTQVLNLPEVELDVVFLLARRVSVANLRAAKISAIDLKARGAEHATTLRELGFDAMDLCDASFCASAVSSYGVDAVRRAFLLQPGDAVALAGSTACFQLDLSVRRLLEACAGAPDAARAVLQQSEPRGGALQGVSAGILLDCGISSNTLAKLSYFVDRVRDQTDASEAELAKLGF